MSVSSILDSTSYATLDAAGQKAVFGLFDKYRRGKRLALDTPLIVAKRKSLSVSLDFYGSRLNQINPASFKFLRPRQRMILHQELLYAFYVFSAQYQLDEAEHRGQELPARSAQIRKCAYLINELRRSSKKKTPELLLSRPIDDSEKHAKYLGLTIAPAIAGLMLDIGPDSANYAEEWKGAGKTTRIKEWMGAVNGVRLTYWIWGGSLLSSIFSLLPDNFGNLPQAKQGIAAPAPVGGYMSWLLYFTRFGINLSLLLKHTLAGPWMSAEEAKIPWWERFKTQWDQRKFALLNDSIWGLANMACFLWLTGSGMLGYYGNVVTAGLLLMDVCLGFWRWWQENTQHNADMARYNRDIELLRQEINLENTEEERKQRQQQLKTLQRAREQCEFNWLNKNKSLKYDAMYAVALLAAFTIMVSVLFPPALMAPATAMILGLVGAALCYVITTLYAAASGRLEITKSKETKRVRMDECKLLLEQFKVEKDELTKKQWYLDMKQLLAESHLQQQLIHYQNMKLIRSVFIDAMVPLLVFVSLMFMPLGVGIGVIAAGFALAVISGVILKRFEPKAAELPEFDEAAYASFAELQDPTIDDLYRSKRREKQEKQIKHQQGFFAEESDVSSFPSEGIFNDDGDPLVAK